MTKNVIWSIKLRIIANLEPTGYELTHIDTDYLNKSVSIKLNISLVWGI